MEPLTMEMSNTAVDLSTLPLRTKRLTRMDIQSFLSELKFPLNANQRKGVLAALTSKVIVVTGGPGVGKTTTSKTIIQLLRKDGERVVQCAPTGKAAKRLGEVTGFPATTIHRLLEPALMQQAEVAQLGESDPLDDGVTGAAGSAVLDDGEKQARVEKRLSDEKDEKEKQRGMVFAFQRNEHNPLECTCVVVDESSMVDAALMASLCRALPDDCKLILIGDVDQLPSVGAGNVLRDIIASEKFPVATLTEIMRQGADSYIVRAAHNINNGKLPLNGEDWEKSEDFTWINEGDEGRILAHTLQIAIDNDAQIIVPMHKPSIGTANLNREMQLRVNPHNADKREVEYGMEGARVIYRVGDKVMNLRNDYSRGIYNGDVGYITKILEKDEAGNTLKSAGIAIEIAFEGIDGEGKEKWVDAQFAKNELMNITHAWAITVHKSQGSEWPNVVIPLHQSHHIMLQRNLLYTAITRAKKHCWIVGNERVVGQAARTVMSGKRNTMLREMLVCGK